MGGLLPILTGCCTIQLMRRIGGLYGIVGNTLVDESKYYTLNQYRWLMRWNPHTQSCYAYRVEHHGKKTLAIFVAREVIGLLPGVGQAGGVADHRNHDTLDNREENLRIATNSGSCIHRKKWGSLPVPKGVSKNKHGSGYRADIHVNGLRANFPTVLTMNEAWFIRKEAEKLLHVNFNYSENIPEDQMPTEERQQYLLELTLKILRQKGFIV
jgi:hypothetical protein